MPGHLSLWSLTCEARAWAGKELLDTQAKLKEASDAAEVYNKDAVTKGHRVAALEAQVRAQAEEIETLKEQLKTMVSKADLARVR